MLSQAMENMEPARAYLAAISAISARLGQTPAQPEILELMMEAIIQLTQAERGCILLYHPTTRQWELGAAHQLTWSPLEKVTGSLSLTIVEQAAISGAPVLTSNAHTDQRYNNQPSIMEQQLRSIMCVPLRVRDQTAGVIYVDNRLVSGVFSQLDLELLVAFAGQAALALDNARLIVQTDLALARRVEELTLFQQIDRQLNRSLELNEVLQLALDWALRLTRTQRGAVGLWHTDEQGRPAVEVVVQHPAPPRPIRPPDMPYPILEQLWHSQRPVHSRFNAAEPERQPTPITQLATPIWCDGKQSGFIWLESGQAEAFTSEDIALVERLGDRVAAAIDKARLYQAVQAAQHMQAAFVSMLLHEMRNPMMTIRGYSELLTLIPPQALTEQQTSWLKTIMRNVDKMELLLRDLSDLVEMEAGALSVALTALDVRVVIHECLDLFRDACRARRQGLVAALPSDLPLVYADPARTAQILTNLLSNAHKYTLEGGIITVRAAVADDQVEVTVSDTGIGIARADHKRLFSPFFRADHAWVRQQPGWGLGLTIVKSLVEAQGGALRLHSTPGQGSAFVFTLPLAPTETMS